MDGDSHKRKREDGVVTQQQRPTSNGSSSAIAMDAPQPPEKKIKTEPALATSTSISNGPSSTSTPPAIVPAPAATTRKRRRWDTAEPVGGAAAAASATSAPTPAIPASASASVAPTPKTDVLTAAQKAAAMQKSIAERLAALKNKLPLPTSTAAAATTAAASTLPVPSVTVKEEKATEDKKPAWLPLRLDAQGRQIDERGNVIQLERPRELLANQKASLDAAAASAAKQPHTKISGRIIKTEGQSKFFDPRMAHGDGKAPTNERRARPMLNFVRPGKYVAQAASMRMRQLEREMAMKPKKEEEEEAQKEAAARAAADAEEQFILKRVDPPMLEWWDAKILKDNSYESELNDDRITSYIYHPVGVAPLVSDRAPQPAQVLLTKKERRKIKKREKRESLQEKRDRIKLGLDPPPEPKMRIQNLMNVLLNSTVADPSAMEAKVRQQMAERVQGHEEANAARALTAEQKAEKRRKKYTEDLSHEVHVAVYRVSGEVGGDGKARYQLDVNAQQWNLGGVAIIHPGCNVIIVEGGPKGLRRFKRLMLRRIRWKKRQKSEMEKEEEAMKRGKMKDEGEGQGEANDENEYDDESDEESSSDDEDEGDTSLGDDTDRLTHSRHNHAILVWSGLTAAQQFGGRFNFESCRSESMARSYLARMGIQHYFDMCKNYREHTDL